MAYKAQEEQKDMLLEQMLAMAHSPVRNYAIPGLTSWLIGGVGPTGGLVRLFHSARKHVEPITPHSHRFDFTAQVLKGEVTNRLWREATDGSTGDLYCVSKEKYLGAIGKYEVSKDSHAYYRFYDETHRKGTTYKMASHEMHSIYFDRDTYVLMFEGPQKTDTSLVLEPVVDGKCIPTFKVEDWMFERA